jgi:hypothetical protein
MADFTASQVRLGFIRKYPGGNISQCHLGENMKRGREKGGNVKEKGRMEKEKLRKGKEKDKRGSKRVK